MKILFILEKMTTGSKTIELTNLLIPLNKKWFEEHKLSDPNASYVRPLLYSDWILHNKKDELENILLKFGKTFAPSLTKVYVDSNYNGIASCFSPSDFSIHMASSAGAPVVVWNEFGDKVLGQHFSHFVSTFIHELYHAVQYEQKRGIGGKGKKRTPLSNDSSYWTDRKQNVGDSNTKTYDHHTVTKVELEAMANDQFSETLFNQFAFHDHQTIIRYYPTWSKFMSKLRSIGRDPESVAQQILKRNDETHFNKDNKIEAEAIKYFIKEYLKVAQDFYYKGMDDETGKYEKQRELGVIRKKMKFKRVTQETIERELAQHFDEMNEKINKMTAEQIQHGLLFSNSEFSIVHKIIKTEYFSALKADIHKLNQKIQDGGNINNWILKHIPNQIKKVCGLKSIFVEFIPDSFELPELTFSEGVCSVKFHYFSEMTEENFEDLIFGIINTCISDTVQREQK